MDMFQNNFPTHNFAAVIHNTDTCIVGATLDLAS